MAEDESESEESGSKGSMSGCSKLLVVFMLFSASILLLCIMGGVVVYLNWEKLEQPLAEKIGKKLETLVEVDPTTPFVEPRDRLHSDDFVRNLIQSDIVMDGSVYEIFTKNRIMLPPNLEEQQVWERLNIDSGKLRPVIFSATGSSLNGEGSSHYQISKSFAWVLLIF